MSLTKIEKGRKALSKRAKANVKSVTNPQKYSFSLLSATPFSTDMDHVPQEKRMLLLSIYILFHSKKLSKFRGILGQTTSGLITTHLWIVSGTRIGAKTIFHTPWIWDDILKSLTKCENPLYREHFEVFRNVMWNYVSYSKTKWSVLVEGGLLDTLLKKILNTNWDVRNCEHNRIRKEILSFFVTAVYTGPVPRKPVIKFFKKHLREFFDSAPDQPQLGDESSYLLSTMFGLVVTIVYHNKTFIKTVEKTGVVDMAKKVCADGNDLHKHGEMLVALTRVHGQIVLLGLEERKRDLRKSVDSMCFAAGCEESEVTCKLRICSACAIVSYCSAACQNRDWKSHKHLCNSVKCDD